MTIDNLVAADVVLADGTFVTVSENRHEDLFWALRGGGGNFGVVTSFTFRLHPVGTVVGGPTLWPMEAAGDVLRWYRESRLRAPDDVYGFFAFVTVPPAPAQTLRAVHEPAEPALHSVHTLPYPMLQSAFDGLYPRGFAVVPAR